MTVAGDDFLLEQELPLCFEISACFSQFSFHAAGWLLHNWPRRAAAVDAQSSRRGLFLFVEFRK